MPNQSSKPKTTKSIKIAVAALIGFIGVSYGIYAITGDESNPSTADTAITTTLAPNNGVTRALSVGSMTAFVVKPKRADLSAVSFQDGEGQTHTLADWQGQVVLLNLWATWCAPCRSEMPALANLQDQLGSDAFEVVAVSVDRKGVKASAKFLTDTKADKLNLYIDSSSKILNQVKSPGLPTTILIDRKGHEIGRLVGPAHWDAPEAIALIKAALKEAS